MFLRRINNTYRIASQVPAEHVLTYFLAHEHALMLIDTQLHLKGAPVPEEYRLKKTIMVLFTGNLQGHS